MTGQTATVDPTIAKAESGHPIRHEFTRAIPSSQCMVCHMHQPNMFVNSFYGTIMWDYEADAPAMWPKQQKYPTDEQARAILDRNPEAAATRGNWGDLEFLRQRRRPQPQAEGHPVRRLPRPRLEFPRGVQARPQGHLLDSDGPRGARRPIPTALREGGAHDGSTSTWASSASTATSPRTRTATAIIYGEVAAAIEIGCADCHGTADALSDAAHLGPGRAARRART